MKFVDRIEETAKLKKALARHEPSLYVVYGRRRLGKSTLLSRLLGKGDVYFMAGKQDQTQQRILLASTIAFNHFGFDKAVYPDWESLFISLNVYMHGGETVPTLCLDEFPYMVKSCPDLPSVLQRLIDMRRLSYHVVICGSSQHMMQDLVLNAGEPLYGRARDIVKFLPIKIKYLPQALPMLTAEEAVENYAVFGGVPRYWELRSDEDSLEDMVMDMIANPIGMLYEEPEKLLADDLEQTALSSSILSLIGNGVNRMAEISARLNRKSTDLSNPIRKLLLLGYIDRETPFGENQKNSKKSLYKLNDQFLSFHYRFVVPQQSAINRGMADYVSNYISANFADFVANEWERLCRLAVSGSHLFGIAWGVASRWWGAVGKGRQAEFDVVAESVVKGCLLIGECKWTKEENASVLLEDLKRRSEGFAYAKGRKVFYVLFLRNIPADGNKDYVVLPRQVVEGL